MRLVWTHRRTSRAEIARRTGLSRSTVSNIVDDLFETGVLQQAGDGPSIGGKPPRMLAFDDGGFGLIGVDLGASHVGVALTDLRGEVLSWEHVDHDVRDDPTGALATVEHLVKDAIDGRPRIMRRVVGIGVAVPAPLDPRRPNELSPRVLPAWRDVRLAEHLEARFGGTVVADNDANLGALAERWWGAGRDGQDLAYLKLATGIGCGLILGGTIHRGARFLAGEIGHIAVDPHGPLCSCGQHGCLVTFAGARALVDRARRLSSAPVPDLSALIRAARSGDETAAGVIGYAAEHLSLAVWNLVNLLNPATVVLGGTLSEAGDRILLPISSALLARHNWTSDTETRLVVSELGESGIALGAATAVLDRALADPSWFDVALTA